MPDVIGVLPALLAFTAAVFLIALSRAYDYSLGALLRVLVLALDVGIPLPFHTIHPFSFLANAVQSLDNDIRAAIGKGIEALEYDAAFWFSWMARINEAIGQTIADVAESTYHALRRHAAVTVPGITTALLAPLRAAVHRLEAQVAAHVPSVPVVITRVVKVAKSYPVTVERVTGLPRLVKAAVASAIAALPVAVPLPRIGRLEADVAALRHRLARAGSVIGAGAIVGAVALALSKLGLTESQCSNAKRWSKGMCRADRNWIESLLADGLVIGSSLSLIEFAREMVTVQEAATEPIRLFWRVR